MSILDEYAAEMARHWDAARATADAVHEGGRSQGRREGRAEAEVETRARVLKEVAAAIRAEARRGTAPARQHLTYEGGLRRAAAIVDRLAAATPLDDQEEQEFTP